MPDLDVEAINVARREAVLTDGQVVPITNLFDAIGDETEDTAEAVTFVCGDGRMWFSDLIESFETVRTQ